MCECVSAPRARGARAPLSPARRPASVSRMAPAAPEELEDGWEQRESKRTPGVFYYIQPETGRTQLEAPLRNKRRRTSPGILTASDLPGKDWAASGKAAGGDGGLFDGLPEATTETCSTAKETVPEVKKKVSAVRCLHLLKKHTGSRRPSSWRQKHITRTVEEATYELKELRKSIAAKATPAERQAEFERLARKESDCSSAAEGGSLGKFGRGKMQKPFEDASFALQVQELSGIVSTHSGMHLILRLE